MKFIMQGLLNLLVVILISILSTGCGGKKNQDKSNMQSQEGNAVNPQYADIDIFSAALNGDSVLVALALQNGKKANSTDQDSRTPLMYAAYNGHSAIMRLLISRGAGVDMKDREGRTALMMAASGPFPAAVKLLLDNFADPNITDKTEHFTALMFAATEGQTEVARILLASGANPSLKDVDGDDALIFAERNGHKETAALIEKAVKGR